MLLVRLKRVDQLIVIHTERVDLIEHWENKRYLLQRSTANVETILRTTHPVNPKVTSFIDLPTPILLVDENWSANRNNRTNVVEQLSDWLDQLDPGELCSFLLFDG
jgi:hypothetical protein